MKLNIAVVFGNKSVEHEISIISAIQTINAIDKDKYNVIPIYITKQGVWYGGEKLLKIENYKNIDQLLTQCNKIVLPQNSDAHCLLRSPAGLFGDKVLDKIDVIFPVMHGTYGEDGLIQGFFELMNIPYVGSNVLSSAITMDKVVTKMCLQSLGIPVLDYVSFYSNEWIKDKSQVLSKIKTKLTFPLIVKPTDLGSSIGITIVNDDEQLEDAIDLAVSVAERVLIEPTITNLKEVNCAILGDHDFVEVSMCEEPIGVDEILSYRDKYINEGATKTSTNAQGMSGAKRKLPADISESTKNEIESLAKKAFIELNCSGVARIDFLIDQNTNKIYLGEINPIPGSLAFYLWEPVGKSFTALTNRLIELALKRHRENNNLTFSYETNILSTFSGGGLKGKAGSQGKL